MQHIEITDDMVLGYRDYVIDRKTKKDFPTLDSVVDWLNEVLYENEITKEFCDYAEQEFGLDAIKKRMKEKYPEYPYDWSKLSLEESTDYIFAHRDQEMHAAEFEEAKIPQKKD